MRSTSRSVVRASFALLAASLGLFVALGGTAGASEQAAVPLAKRALVADKAKVANTAKIALVAQNAQKLGGQTSAQIVQAAVTQASAAPGPASTAVSLITTKSGSVQLGAGAIGTYQIACDAGQRVLSGGFISDNAVLIAVGNGPLNDTTWGIGLFNLDDSAPANVNLYAVCIK